MCVCKAGKYLNFDTLECQLCEEFIENCKTTECEITDDDFYFEGTCNECEEGYLLLADDTQCSDCSDLIYGCDVCEM